MRLDTLYLPPDDPRNGTHLVPKYLALFDETVFATDPYHEAFAEFELIMQRDITGNVTSSSNSSISGDAPHVWGAIRNSKVPLIRRLPFIIFWVLHHDCSCFTHRDVIRLCVCVFFVSFYAWH